MVGKEVGNYQIQEKLGESTTGAVFKALDADLDRAVAIKALNIEFAGNPQLEQRFRAEVKALGNLNHPNLTTLYALLIDDGRPWLVMEFLEGETFGQMVRRRGPIPSEEAIPLFRQALLGMGSAHRMGIVHRALKPANLMLNRQGIVKVMDAGVAKVLRARGSARNAGALGTADYMSPEQFLNRPVDFRSDVYSLGVALYEMLTAKLPFRADNDYQIMADHVNTPPPPPTQFYSYIPKPVEQAVLRAIEKNPDLRFQTVEEFGAALENQQPYVAATAAGVGGRSTVVSVAHPVAAPVAPVAIEAEPQVSPVQSSPPPASGWLSTNERKIIAACVVAILVLAGVLFAVMPKLKRANEGAAPDSGQPSAAVTANPDQPAAPADGVAVAPAQPDAAAVAVAPAPVFVIPAGTPVAVRTQVPIDSSAIQVGQRFTALVDAPVVVDGAVVIPVGAPARVDLIALAQAPAAPRTDVQLELVRLSIGGTFYRSRSSIFEQQSAAIGKHSAGAAGVGAAVGAIGGIFGHKGAAAGAAAGATSAFAIYIPPQTRIQFTLRRDIAVSQ